ncbi:transcription factor HES-2-like [Salminus brasiliensis]|uniref:transcription factor HES-2-like n=1 Tax=Salminus brasiliensis TaxID=930266 RepID=UPI003B82EED6
MDGKPTDELHQMSKDEELLKKGSSLPSFREHTTHKNHREGKKEKEPPSSQSNCSEGEEDKEETVEDRSYNPAITSATTISKELLPLNNKLRKPVVEKMRSIEQLKTLLAPQFLNQQPDSKLEKADILEMTVSVLRRQQSAVSSSSAAVNQGFSRCVHEIVNFLSKDEVKTHSQRKQLFLKRQSETISTETSVH